MLPVSYLLDVKVTPLVSTTDVDFMFPLSSYTVSLTPVYVTLDVVLLSLSESDGYFPPFAVVVIPLYEISFLV